MSSEPPEGERTDGPAAAAAGSDSAAGAAAEPDRSAATLSETLSDSRDRIDDLATDDGAFTVVCKTSGERPVPVASVAFDAYDDAERARDAAGRYRDTLRRLDPSLPNRDLGVSAVGRESVQIATVRESTGRNRANGLPETRRTVTVAGGRRDEWLRIENGPVVDLTGRDGPLDDEFVSRQLRAELDP